MANSLTKSPLIVDTAAGTMVTTKNLTVRAIRWVDATTAGHLAVIQDVDSRVIWSCAATGDGFTHESNIGLKISGGFKVPTLDSGILYLYLDNQRDA